MTEINRNQRSDFFDYFTRLLLVWGAQALLHFCYRDLISPRYESEGLVFLDTAPQRLVLWNFLCSLPVLILPKDWARPAHIILWYLYMVLVMPLGVLSLDMGKDDTLVLATISFVLPFCIMVAIYQYLKPMRSLQLSEIPMSVLTIGVTVVCLLGAIILLRLFGKSMSLSWDALYDRRHEAREVTGIRSYLGYAVTLFSQAVIPVALALGLRKFGSHSLIAVLAIFASFTVFGFNGTKTALFVPVLMIALAVAMANRLTQARYLLLGLITILSGAYISDRFLDSSFLSEFILRRAFAIPVLLEHAYLEFFQPENYVYFTDLPFMQYIVGDVYDERSASFIIGQEFFGKSELNANVGAIAYGYAECGLLGSWLMSGCVLLLLILLEKGTIRKDPRWTVLLACAIAIHLSEQAFQTSLLTGGVLPILAIILLTQESRKTEAIRSELPVPVRDRPGGLQIEARRS